MKTELIKNRKCLVKLLKEAVKVHEDLQDNLDDIIEYYEDEGKESLVESWDDKKEVVFSLFMMVEEWLGNDANKLK